MWYYKIVIDAIISFSPTPPGRAKDREKAKSKMRDKTIILLATIISLAMASIPQHVSAMRVETNYPADTNLQVPVINYHRFLPDRYETSTGMKRRLSDFRADLQKLYDAGYTLISIDDLVDGNIHVPAGRRPLVLTIDDAFFADQLWLDETGVPSDQCGIGVLYRFYQEHPNFGFQVAMFANFGDKYYGNVYRNGWWYVGDGWQEALAQAIVWGIEHGVIPYNHLYIHPRLDMTEYQTIQSEEYSNDAALRDLLARAGRADLIDQVNNYIALPYGLWPADQAGIDKLLGYTDPEGRAVKAVFEAGYEYMPEYAEPYAADFDPYHIPRLAGIDAAIESIVELAKN